VLVLMATFVRVCRVTAKLLIPGNLWGSEDFQLRQMRLKVHATNLCL
jgi:hypothetical protein